MIASIPPNGTGDPKLGVWLMDYYLNLKDTLHSRIDYYAAAWDVSKDGVHSDLKNSSQ